MLPNKITDISTAIIDIMKDNLGWEIIMESPFYTYIIHKANVHTHIFSP